MVAARFGTFNFHFRIAIVAVWSRGGCWIETGYRLRFSMGLFKGIVSLLNIVLIYMVTGIFMSLLNCAVDFLVNGLVLAFMLC